MDCPTVRSLFTDYQHGDLSPRDQDGVSAHLRDCPRCADEYRQFRTALNWLGELDRPEPPAEIRRRVLGRLREDTRTDTRQQQVAMSVAAILTARWAAAQRRSRYYLAGGAGLALAAALSVMLVLVHRASAPRPAEQATEAVAQGKAAKRLPHVAALPPRAERMTERKDLAGNVAGELTSGREAARPQSPRDESLSSAPSGSAPRRGASGSRAASAPTGSPAAHEHARESAFERLEVKPETAPVSRGATTAFRPGAERPAAGPPRVSEGAATAMASSTKSGATRSAEAMSSKHSRASVPALSAPPLRTVRQPRITRAPGPSARIAAAPAETAARSAAKGPQPGKQAQKPGSSSRLDHLRSMSTSADAHARRGGRASGPAKGVAADNAKALKHSPPPPMAMPGAGMAAGGGPPGGGGLGGGGEGPGLAAVKRKAFFRAQPVRKLTASELQLSVPARTQVGQEVPVTVTVRPRQPVRDAEVTLLFSNGLTAKNARVVGAFTEKALGRWTFKPNETVRLPLRLTANASGAQSIQVRVVSDTAAGQQSGKLQVAAAPRPKIPAGVEYRFQGADLRRVLQNLGRRIGKRVILAPEVTGKLTYNVTDPDPEKVLRDICARNGLKVTETGQELHIAPMPRPGG